MSGEPWFTDAIPHLGLRPGSRVLMLTVGSAAQAESVLHRIGEEGSLTVVDPDPLRVEQVGRIDHPELTVMAYTPDGAESFGVHDVLVGVPASDPGWAPNRWAELCLNNLRPGGRLLLDLPGERHCSTIQEIWLENVGDEEPLQAWNGPDDRALARSLRGSGLRAIESYATTHLVRFETAREAAEQAVSMLGVDSKHGDDLHLGFAPLAGADGSLEVVFQRSRVVGMR